MRWTRKSPPNYVERAHAILGRTVDESRVWDVAAITRGLRAASRDRLEWKVIGRGQAGVIAAYAALFEPSIKEVVLVEPPATHREGPIFLNVLRVLDIPDALGLLAPQVQLTLVHPSKDFARTARLYRLAGAAERFEWKEARTGAHRGRQARPDTLAAEPDNSADGKRYGVAVDLHAYPQATAKQTLGSVLKAIDAGRLDYVVAQLADPAFIDERIKRLHGGQLAQQVEDTRRRLDRATVKLLRRFLDDGEWTEHKDAMIVRLKGIKDRCIYLSKKGERWYLQNRSTPPRD